MMAERDRERARELLDAEPCKCADPVAYGHESGCRHPEVCDVSQALADARAEALREAVEAVPNDVTATARKLAANIPYDGWSPIALALHRLQRQVEVERERIEKIDAERALAREKALRAVLKLAREEVFAPPIVEAIEALLDEDGRIGEPLYVSADELDENGEQEGME